MAQTLTVAPAGLFTDPNPLSAAPDGAMTEALNVVIARPGVVEPRPGLQAQSTFTAIAVDEDIIRMIPFEDDILVLTKDVSDSTGHAYWYTANDDMVQAGTFMGASSAWTFTIGEAQAATLGGNLYITSGEGVFRCTAPGDDNAYRAGIPRPPQTMLDKETTGWVNYPHVANTAWSNRICETATAGRLTIRSAPSARILGISYTGSSDAAIEHTFARTPSNISEFYESAATAAYTDQPSDEMTLIGTAAASATEFNDDASDVRGASLYTNATQEGALLENGMPPICKDVASFRDMLFFAGATRAPVLTFEVLGLGSDWRGGGGSQGSERLVGLYPSGTVTLGSPTITGISAGSIAGMRVGMRIVSNVSTDAGSADAVFPDDTYITAVGATDITINNNALANDTVFGALDWIEIAVTDVGGTQTERIFLGGSVPPDSATHYVDATEFRLGTGNSTRGAQTIAHKFSRLFTDPLVTVSAFGDGSTTPWTFIVESFAYDVTSITVKISNSGATPDRIDRTTGKTATASGSVATLMWSKPGEPEHVPSGASYSKEIGAADKAIERIIPTRDALIVFKEDGVWRVSGYSPDTLQIDELDRTMRLVHPDAACEWNGRVAAWTNKGVMLVSDGGAEEISRPIANLIEAAGETHAGNGAKGVFLAGWLDKEMLLLGIPSSTSTGYAEYIYCWSQRTGAWTRWSHASRITTACAVGKDLYFGTRAADSSSDAVVLKAVAESYDVSTAVTVSSVSSTTVTISGGSGWTPAVGDILRQSSVDYAVTAITSSTVFTVHTTGVTAAAATGLTRTAMQVEWTVRDGENPGAQKHFREVTFVLGSASGLVANDNSFTSDRSQTAGTSSSSLTYTTSDVPTTIRTRIPREARRCGRLEHALTLKGAKPGWQLHGASYVFEPLSTRFRDAS
jgi:hypothetical protein